MLLNLRSVRVFVYRDHVDMRKGHDGLSYLVTHHMNLDLLSGAIFVFVSRNRKTLKALAWDGTGLVIIHKRMEKGRVMRFDKFLSVQTVTMSEIALILEGNHVSLPLSPTALTLTK